MKRIIQLAFGMAMAWSGVACRESPAPDEVEVPLNQIHAPGYVEPEGRLRRLSFAVPGVLREVLVGVGDFVEKGEVLARLDLSVEQARVTGCQAELEKARAELARLRAGSHPEKLRAVRAAVEEASAEARYRESEARRLADLFAEDGISRKEMLMARYQAQVATARLERIEANAMEAENVVRPEELVVAEMEVRSRETALALAKEEWQRGVLRAPESGQVLEIFRRQGERVDSSAAMLFAPEGPLMVRSEVDEGFVGKVAPSQRVWVTSPDGQRVEGAVTGVKPVMGEKRVFTLEARERLDLQIFEVFVRLRDPEIVWPFGLEVDVVIEGEGSR